MVPRRYLITQALTAFGWSLLCVTLIMPALDNLSGYHQMAKYPALGNSVSELLETVFTHPFTIFRALFEDTEGLIPLGTGVKLEFYFILLMSGGWALLRSWPFFLMTVPLIAQKMLHADSSKWGLFAHYSIEFSVVLPLAVFAFLFQIRSTVHQRTIGILSVMMTIGATLYCLEFPLEHSDRNHSSHDSLRFYQTRHYTPYLDQVAMLEALELIPNTSSVSAMYTVVPHLIAREKLYQFPLGQDSDHILLVTNIYPYPLTNHEFTEEVHKLRSSEVWKVIYDRSHVLLFERRTSPLNDRAGL